jgi:hypothetical protein
MQATDTAGLHQLDYSLVDRSGARAERTYL